MRRVIKLLNYSALLGSLTKFFSQPIRANYTFRHCQTYLLEFSRHLPFDRVHKICSGVFLACVCVCVYKSIWVYMCNIKSMLDMVALLSDAVYIYEYE